MRTGLLQCPRTRDEVIALRDAEDWVTLEKRLGKRIQFGTAGAFGAVVGVPVGRWLTCRLVGLRGAVAAGFACMNDLVIVQATQGFCQHLLLSDPTTRRAGVVIGHDHRHGSEQFARLAAGVFVQAGVRVHWFNQLVHTPMVVRRASHPLSVALRRVSAAVHRAAS